MQVLGRLEGGVAKPPKATPPPTNSVFGQFTMEHCDVFTLYRVRQNKMSQYENRFISEMRENRLE